MNEDLNDAPVAFEDQQEHLKDIQSLKVDEIQCDTCKKIFTFSNQIKDHIEKEDHYSFRIKRKENQNFEEVKCNICLESNIQKLYFILNNSNIVELKQVIYCQKHFPPGNKDDKIPILEYIEEEIAKRKFNKVQLRYKDKENYYDTLKPLVIADMIYTRNLYESKEEYEFEVLEKNERYYFEIPENFSELNINRGRVLKFTKTEDNNIFEFLAVITNYEMIENKDYNLLKIRINPINKHITSLKGHTGRYKIKEGFCLIPYERMLEALKIFDSDIPDDENEIFERAVSLYLTERILGTLPFDGKSEDKDLKKKVDEILKIEKNTMDLLFDKDDNKLNENINDFGQLNESQIKALKHIFENPLNMVQGPPGTGKTFLASFIVYNIFKMRREKDNKILLCTPSNSAADNLTSYLIRINLATGNKMKLLRVYAKTRESLEINKDIEKISLHYLLNQKYGDDLEDLDKSELEEETKEIINEHDIIISTCSTSGDERLKNIIFPFILIDEATQCCELEAMIPIVHGCQHLTLIGDQKQLGPVVLHPLAKKYGMNISLFERMLKLYPHLFTMLTIQYRMHPEIVKFPSEQFYDNKIENRNNLINERILSEEINKGIGWPIKNIPLLFLHVKGEEKIISGSKSKYNEEEANIIVQYIVKLLKLGIKLNDIGVITPYIAQIERIKSLLKMKKIEHMNNLKISSVDGFQGGEKKFIILSNVRSNKENNIGFLKDFRRLNVSITRAIFGMIIIGNAECLYQEESVWKNFINYYQRNKLIYSPYIYDKEEEKEKGEKYNIDELEKVIIGNDEDINLIEEPFIYGKYEEQKKINEDLLNNFECLENNYAEENINYLRKKQEKKNKKYNKK